MGIARAVLMLVATVAFVAPRPAFASPITIHFAGTLQYLSIYEPFTPPYVSSGYNGSFGGGSPFSGSLTFDDSASDSNVDVTVGDYSFSTPPFTATLQFGTYTLSSSSSGFTTQVLDNYRPEAFPSGYDGFYLLATNVSAVGAPAFSFAASYFSLLLENETTGSTLSSDSLASVPFSLASWPDTWVFFHVKRAGYPYSFSGGGTLNSLVVVPESSTSLLLWLGVTGFGIRRWFAAQR